MISTLTAAMQAAGIRSTNDLDWFASNPDRSHRLRVPFPDEIDDESCEHVFVIVRQHEPGKHETLDYTPLHPPPERFFSDECLLHTIFDARLKLDRDGDYADYLEIFDNAEKLRESLEVMQ